MEALNPSKQESATQFKGRSSHRPIISESAIKQVCQIQKAHKDSVRSIQYIDTTDVPIVMTASSDRKVKIFEAEEGTKLGTLKQGYMSKANYKWNFPFKGYLSKTHQRVASCNTMLTDLRFEANDKMSVKKRTQIQRMEKEVQRSRMGMAGSAIMGFG